MSSNELTTVEFHGATLIARRGATPADTLVAMKPVAEGMGLDWATQFRKIQDHPVLGTCIVELTMQMPGDDQVRRYTALPLNRLNFWLATIQPNKVPDEATRERVIRYQIECADALFDHFFGRAMGQPSDPLETLIARAQPLLERMVDALVDARIKADPRIAAVANVRALTVAIDHGVLPKGRRPLVRAISDGLTLYCQQNGLVILRDDRNTKTFPIAAVGPWLKAGGAKLIREHKARTAEPPPLFRAIDGGKAPRPASDLPPPA